MIDHYNIVGPVKAALEFDMRGLAVQLGRQGIHVHALSPGPILSPAASGINHFDEFLEQVAQHSPQQYLISIAAAALLMTGCASMAPPYEVPALPVSPVYASVTTQDGANAAAIGWRDYFTDPQLQSLISLALDNNRDLRSAVLRVEEAHAAYGIQRADLFPSIGAQAREERSRTPARMSLTGRPLVASQYQVGVGLASWEIDFWGRLRSLDEAALETYLATDAASRAASIGLVAQVANNYLALRGLDERIALARQTIASREESFRIFTRRVEVGSTSLSAHCVARLVGHSKCRTQ